MMLQFLEKRCLLDASQIDNKAELKMSIVVSFVYIFLASRLFQWQQNWSFISSLYFVIVTLPTIGV